MKISILKKVRYGEIRIFLNELHEDGRLYRLDLEQIAKIFLNQFVQLPGSAFEINFKKLRKAYAEVTFEPKKEIPVKPNRFFVHVCEKYLHLSKAPKDLFFNLYNDAINDLNQIENNLKECNKQLHSLQSKKDNIPEDADADIFVGIKDKIKFYKYYIERNDNARDTIIDFLRHEIKYQAWHQAQRQLSGIMGLSLKLPYHFRYASDIYNPNYFSEWHHRLRNMLLDEFHRLLGKEIDDEDAFLAGVDKYIDNSNITSEIRGRLDSCYYLSKRKSVITFAIDEYTKKRYDIFCRLVVLEIEGVFYDMCRSFGIKSKEIDQQSVSVKVQRLLERNEWFSYHEYFLYRFPAYRNAIAHGKLIDDSKVDYCCLAKKILLDLDYVTEEITNPNNLVNQLVLTIKEGGTSRASLATFKAAVALSLKDVRSILDTDIRKFYSINNHVELIEKSIKKKETWNMVERFVLKSVKDMPFDMNLFRGAKSFLIAGIERRLGKSYFINLSKTITRLEKQFQVRVGPLEGVMDYLAFAENYSRKL